jgi:hypothetical protein
MPEKQEFMMALMKFMSNPLLDVFSKTTKIMALDGTSVSEMRP